MMRSKLHWSAFVYMAIHILTRITLILPNGKRYILKLAGEQVICSILKPEFETEQSFGRIHYDNLHAYLHVLIV